MPDPTDPNRRSALRRTRVPACAMLFCALATLVGGTNSLAQTAGDADYEKLLAEKSPAVVTIKFVMKLKGASGENESEGEATGLMIASDGLVLCSNSQLGGGPMVRPGFSATPTEIKVLTGDDSAGLDARLIARDSELDLTWLRIKNPGDKPHPFVDVAASATPKLGEKLFTIVRLGKYFDRAAVVREARLAGATKKPRTLFVPSPSLGDLALPIFSATGQFVGFSVVQLPDAEELQAATSMAAFAGARGLILPAQEIVKATRRAKEADEAGDGAAPKAEKSVDSNAKPKE